MKVILAGYNIDGDVIEELKKNSPPRDDITPETLSASYARISRDPRPAFELRAAARAEVERARRSNRNIIFKMGHHSVAEHAVFNFDLIGISRLAMEEVERFRLNSYTEKSQRYVTLKDDYVLPEEIKKAGREDLFTCTVRSQNELYHRLYNRLKPYFFDQNPELGRNPKNHSLIDGWAKEDARYAVSLATEGQLGMTINARNLEYLIRRLASGSLAEVRELNARLYGLAKEVAPSIILFTEANDFDVRTYSELGHAAEKYLEIPRHGREKFKEPVQLVDHTPGADDKILAALLHTSSSRTFEECLAVAFKLKPGEKQELIRHAFQHMEFYDAALREFEYADLTYDLVVSASCFAQLKRHRMATMTWQGYNPELGVTVPQSVDAVGSHSDFMEVIERTNEAYCLLREDVGQAADYILTNAHRKRVLLKVNLRELYHISRLREDTTAQWDIRKLTSEMSRLAREVMPLSCLLLGGKDAFPGLYREIFGKDPKFSPPTFKH